MSETLNFDDVLRAAETLRDHLPPTRAWAYPALDAYAGTHVLVKHENTQPTGAFKVRGGLALVATLAADQLAGGLVTASTGNHAQSIAYAARAAGVTAVVVMPKGSPASKITATRLLGAEVVAVGATLGEAADEGRRLARERGMTYVDPGNTPAIVAGHATTYLELFTQCPDLEALYVPIGSGTGAAGACLVRDRLAPGCAIIGVQSSAAPAAHRSWTDGELREADCTTRHGGLATVRGYALPQSILAGGLARFLLVSDEQIDLAAAALAVHGHTLAEGAGAASLAGLLGDTDRPARCAVVCTGGNAAPGELARLAEVAASLEPTGAGLR